MALITARFSSICPSCELRIVVGSQVNWKRGAKATHVVCPEPAPSDLEYLDQAQANELAIADAADRLCEEYTAQLRATNLADLKKGIYRVSFTGRERVAGVDYLNVNLVPNVKYESVKIGEWQGPSVGYIAKDGRLFTWPDVEPDAPRVKAVLAAVEIVLGAADPVTFAKAYAAESAACWRCGADLVDETSRERLLGPHCYRAVNAA